jgi:hypothetical protein
MHVFKGEDDQRWFGRSSSILWPEFRSRQVLTPRRGKLLLGGAAILLRIEGTGVDRNEAT